MLNRLNLYTILFAYSWEFENLCFISVAPLVCVSRVFVYDAVDVDVNVIVAVSSIKLPSCACVQMTAGLKLYLG